MHSSVGGRLWLCPHGALAVNTEQKKKKHGNVTIKHEIYYNKNIVQRNPIQGAPDPDSVVRKGSSENGYQEDGREDFPLRTMFLPKHSFYDLLFICDLYKHQEKLSIVISYLLLYNKPF